ncbi:hypothetical protein COV17_03735 [Candidatus Woesearchaeota archaeon CG10_big_fil_rev_8_21_14_0_10_36_11]|nr:MAG: hypothetical protein COV17_03735 [Candidatus Woesearchaeota archaeon CG10_big_fil_rev_8_21_14_0_10_36_11]
MVEKQIAWIILNAVKHAQAGKERLAQFLRGAHSQLVRKDAMDRQTGYGSLLWYNLTTISGFIDQLEEMQLIIRYMKNTGYYSYPIIILTEVRRKKFMVEKNMMLF